MGRRGIGELRLNLGLTGIGQRAGTSDTELRTGCKSICMCRTMSVRGPQNVQPPSLQSGSKGQNAIRLGKGISSSASGCNGLRARGGVLKQAKGWSSYLLGPKVATLDLSVLFLYDIRR